MCKCDKCERCAEIQRMNRLIWAWHKRRLRARLAALALAGAATAASAFGWQDWRPDTFDAVAEHVSHMTQHEPFTTHPTEFGYNAALLSATWRLTPAVALTVEDGINLNPRIADCTVRQYGALQGPREVFDARLTFNLWSKH